MQGCRGDLHISGWILPAGGVTGSQQGSNRLMPDTCMRSCAAAVYGIRMHAARTGGLQQTIKLLFTAPSHIFTGSQVEAQLPAADVWALPDNVSSGVDDAFLSLYDAQQRFQAAPLWCETCCQIYQGGNVKAACTAPSSLILLGC